MIEKRKLNNPNVFIYLKEQLTRSGKTLANTIDRLSLEKGKAYAFVPEKTSESQLNDFSLGGIYPYEKPININGPHLVPVKNESREIVIKFILDFINTNTENCCVFEEPHAEPSDPWVSISQIEYIHLDTEMYYFFNKKIAIPDKFENAFVISEGYYFLCALSTLSLDEQCLFRPLKQITKELISKIGDGLKAFIVSAYDGEGYIIWEAN